MSNYKYEYILAFDPSGNFEEGKGTTGWVLMRQDEQLVARGYIEASNYNCAQEYWNEVLELIRFNHRKYSSQLIVVIEEYVLYRDESKGQTNSKMETCRLIGAMQYLCWKLKQDYSMQLATSVKHRWSDELLQREQIIFRDRSNLVHTQSGLSLGLCHTRDAFRHAIHYAVCRNKDKPKYRNEYKGVERNGKYERSNYQSRRRKGSFESGTDRDYHRYSKSPRIWS